jgi:hypothetical protein
MRVRITAFILPPLKHTTLQNEHDQITLQMESQYMDSDSVKNALITVVSLLNGAYALFKSSKTYKKRLLLKTMFSNCFLDGEKLVTTWVDAVSIVGKIRFYPKWQGQIDHIRLHHASTLVHFASLIHPDLLDELDIDESHHYHSKTLSNHNG